MNSIIEFAMPNYILFHREQTLMAQRFDSKKLELDGEAFAIADLVAMVLRLVDSQHFRSLKMEFWLTAAKVIL